MMRTFRYRLTPTKRQARLLNHVLDVSADLYNAALQERRDAWRMRGKSVTLFDQYKQLTELRADDPEIRSIAHIIAREPLRRVNRAFQDFFRRCKAGDKPGYPRFRSKDRYNSFALSWGRPNKPDFRIEDDRIYLPKMGGFRFKLHRPMRGVPRHATVVRSGNRWRLSIVCDVGEAPPKRPVSKPVGIDLGLTTFAVLSDGKSVENPRFLRLAESKVAARQRALCRKKRGSKNRRRARLAFHRVHERIANRRANFCHHVSKWLVANYDLIAFENLNIRAMVRWNLGKSINDAAWGQLIRYVTYKAEGAGKWSVPVNARGTSQLCSRCGRLARKTLDDRWHDCTCGLSISRDANSSLNILSLGRSVAGLTAPRVQ